MPWYRSSYPFVLAAIGFLCLGMFMLPWLCLFFCLLCMGAALVNSRQSYPLAMGALGLLSLSMAYSSGVRGLCVFLSLLFMLAAFINRRNEDWYRHRWPWLILLFWGMVVFFNWVVFGMANLQLSDSN